MAALTARWSRATARDRWAELDRMIRVPVPVGIAVLAIWPLSSVILNWSTYLSPGMTAAILVAAVALPLFLCWLGPRGIGPVTASLAGSCTVALAWLQGAQLDGPHPENAYWMNSWGIAAVVVLAFARPIEESLGVTVGLMIVNVAVIPIPLGDTQALHVSPLSIGAPIPAMVCALALAATLREGVRHARRTRVAAQAAEQRRAVADAVHRERQQRFARWEAVIAPLLEDIAAGRRDPADPVVGQECARLSRRLRAELSAAPESLLESLLGVEIARLEGLGGELVIQDLDVGYRLREDDRLLLVQLVRELCDQGQPGSVQLTMTTGGADLHALVVLSVDGLSIPDSPAWTSADRIGTRTQESAIRWWWDAEVQCEPAPALVHEEMLRTVN